MPTNSVTTSIGTAFTKELLTDIPNARDVWAAMSQAPGFQMQAFDVGGSHTGTQTGYLTLSWQNGIADRISRSLRTGCTIWTNSAAYWRD